MSQVGLLVRGYLTHKQDDRFIVGHGLSHPRNPPVRNTCLRSSVTSPLSPLWTSLSMLHFKWIVHLWRLAPGNTSQITSTKPLRPSTYEPNSRDTSLVKVTEHLTPAKGAFRRFVVDAEHLPGIVILDCKDDIESLRINAVLAVERNTDTVDEHYRIIALQRAFKPLSDITAQIVKHPRYVALL